MRIYIAGPMTGLPNYNFEAFDIARDRLLAWPGDMTVVSPADMDRSLGIEPDAEGKIENFNYTDAMRRCCLVLCDDVDAIYMLNGWNASKGARAERSLSIALGHQIFYESVGLIGADID